ncbi:MAG: acetyltransferase [Labilithrix sp.]|nr:acetyltransferase [Labilithrix sp.]
MIGLRAVSAEEGEDDDESSSADPAPVATPARDYADVFRAWYARERDHRRTWLVETDPASAPVGMLNMLVFERMPKPGRAASRWGYVANAFVLREHRNEGLGTALLDAALAYADEHDFVRVVLSPSVRSIPFYARAGFELPTNLLVRRNRPTTKHRTK